MQDIPSRSSAFESTQRRCYLCERELPLASFRTITTTKRRGSRVYKYVQPSHDCRECNKKLKTEQRRKAAEESGTPFISRAQQRAAREQRKADRQIARAFCRAFRVLARPTRKEEIARIVERQRERRHTDPAYWAARKALKIRRERAKRETQVTPVSIHRVAERDHWKCAICSGAVTRANWSLDHVIPLSKGGPHTYENVVLAHRGCNSSRGAGRFPVQAPAFDKRAA